MSNERKLTELLSKCVSKIDTKKEIGTGFFVSPGLIITCAHVVNAAVKENEPVFVIYGGKKYTTEPVKSDEIFTQDDKDLALLQIDLTEHPCVLLGSTESSANAELHSYGFTLVDGGNGVQKTVVEDFRARLEGERKELKADLTFGNDITKFKDGQVKSGYSGAPLLDVDSGFVTGVVSMTSGAKTNLGGFAIPTKTIYSLFPKLQKLNEEYHEGDKTWTQLVKSIQAQKLYKSVFVFEYKKPNEIPEREYFVPRDELVEQIEMSLDKKVARVLLNGIAGIGKTTLALEIVFNHLSKDKGPVLWVEVGNATTDQIIESIADYYEDQGLKNFKGDLKSRVLLLRQFIKNKKITLVVLDNFAAHTTWLEFMGAIHKDLPVLVTSRSRFNIGDFVDVNQLSPAEAFRLLENILQNPSISTDSDAVFLCQLFGYHPLALKILGANMREVSLDPYEQRQRLETNPTQLHSEVDQDRLWVLIDESTSNLNEIERETFLAFGHFPRNGMTLEFLETYLRRPIEELRNALDHLLVRNLVERRPKTNFYFLHDVIFLYVKSLARLTEENRGVLLAAALNYLEKHSLEYDLIKQDITNILVLLDEFEGIELIHIMSWLTIGGYPEPGPDSYIENKGYPPAFLDKLDKAIHACRKPDAYSKKSSHYLLGKRGDAYFNMGDYEHATSCYEEAISLAPNKKREALVMSVAAKTYGIWGNHQKSQHYFQESYEIAGQLKDDLLLVSIMGQETLVASVVEDFEKIRDIAGKQVESVQRILNTNPSPFAYKHHFFALLNLGAAEMELAKKGKSSFETALPILEHASQVALDQTNDLLLAYVYDSLGELFHYMHDSKGATIYFARSMQLWNQLGMEKDAKELEIRMKSLGYAVNQKATVSADIVEGGTP